MMYPLKHIEAKPFLPAVEDDEAIITQNEDDGLRSIFHSHRTVWVIQLLALALNCYLFFTSVDIPSGQLDLKKPFCKFRDAYYAR